MCLVQIPTDLLVQSESDQKEQIVSRRVCVWPIHTPQYHGYVALLREILRRKYLCTKSTQFIFYEFQDLKGTAYVEISVIRRRYFRDNDEAFFYLNDQFI